MAVRSFVKREQPDMYDVREFYKVMPPLTTAKFWFNVMTPSPHKVEIYDNTCRVYRNAR